MLAWIYRNQMKNMKLGCQNPKIGYFLIILAFMSSIQIYDELRIL